MHQKIITQSGSFFNVFLKYLNGAFDNNNQIRQKSIFPTNIGINTNVIARQVPEPRVLLKDRMVFLITKMKWFLQYSTFYK